MYVRYSRGYTFIHKWRIFLQCVDCIITITACFSILKNVSSFYSIETFAILKMLANVRSFNGKVLMVYIMFVDLNSMWTLLQ